MNVLVLTKKFPFPLKDGESIAVHNLTKAMSNSGVQVDVLSMNTSKHFVEIDTIKEDIEHYNKVVTSFIDNRIKIFDALKNLIFGGSYHIERFDYKDFREKLEKVLSECIYDTVLLESVYLTPYIDTIKKCSKASVVMRAHNVEHEIWQRINNRTQNILKKKYLTIQVDRLKKYEVGALKLIDGLITFTKRDADYLIENGFTGQSIVSPIGIDTLAYDSNIKSMENQTIGFIGSLDWEPNLEGLKWFLDEVWPIVSKRYPKSECHIAGRNPVEEILNYKAHGVIVHGEVNDAIEFVNKYPISIVPLLSGGGMRVKILEAMALKRAIVSTSIGAEGINLDGINIANLPEDFADCICDLFEDNSLLLEKSSEAFNNVKANYDIRNNAEKLISFLRGLSNAESIKVDK